MDHWKIGSPNASPPNARNVTLIPGNIADHEPAGKTG
jgi:hypothetical protein